MVDLIRDIARGLVHWAVCISTFAFMGWQPDAPVALLYGGVGISAYFVAAGISTYREAS